MPQELNLEYACYSCGEKYPLLLSEAETNRIEGKIKGDRARVIIITRTCSKCGERNIISIRKKGFPGRSVFPGSRDI